MRLDVNLLLYGDEDDDERAERRRVMVTIRDMSTGQAIARGWAPRGWLLDVSRKAFDVVIACTDEELLRPV